VRDAADRPRTFFPSQITTYRQCPERYFLQYIEKRRRPRPFSSELVKGGAAHRLIARAIPAYFQSSFIPADLTSQALAEVAATEYPPEERAYLEQDAIDVASWTQTALDMLPRDARALFVERKLFATLGRGPVQLGAQIDLVLEHDDGVIEHVDFKTGKLREDPVQELISRTVVGRRVQREATVRSTTLYVQHRHARSHELDRDECRADWLDIAEAIRAIRSTDTWPARPGPLCDYCPFKARDCSAW
jgi:RecB family exonuclease